MSSFRYRFASVCILLCLQPALLVVDAFAEMLVWTDKDAVSVWKSNPDGTNATQLYGAVDGLQDPRGIAFDVATGALYLADQDTNTIYIGDLDGNALTTFVSALNAPADLVVKGDQLFWTEQGGNRIRRAALNGTAITDIVTGLNAPYYLDVDPVNDVVYWSDFNSGTIHSGGIGIGQTDFITGLDRVRDVELDLDANKIYWADRDRPDIRRQNLDGTGSEVLFTAADGLGRPHGLWIDTNNNLLYWTDTTTGDVVRGSMDGTGSPEIIANGPTSNGPWALQLVVPEPVFASSFFIAVMAIFGFARRRRQ